MASGLEFVQYAADQLRDVGEITYRKMFGEYGLYCDGKIFALVCDDQLFVKITEVGRSLAAAQELPEAPPYEGAKPYFLIEDIDDREFLTAFASATCRALPEHEPKRSRKAAKKAGGLPDGKKSTDLLDEKKARGLSGGRKKEKILSKKMEFISDDQEKGKPVSKKTGTSPDGPKMEEGAGKKKAFDYKREYKEFYMPTKKPQLVEIPPMNFIAVKGEGDPNEEGGAYKQAIGLLYGIAFTIKMSYKGTHKIEGYFPYVVPPLEGLWRQDGGLQGRDGGIDFCRKEDFRWISMIRLPEFVTEEVFEWAVKEASEKKKADFSEVKFFHYDEGLCVQCMHVGPYDDEQETIQKLEAFAAENGYSPDAAQMRAHHEIYLSDPRRAAPEKLKTVIRIPVRKKYKYL